MISILRGEIESVTLSSAVIVVGGVGMEFHAPAPTLATLRVGHEATVYTSLVVREDSLTLYGFADKETRGAFDTITSITGVGPKLGIAVLSVHDADSLRRAISTENKAALQAVPGIGPKSAARMLLELKGKLNAPTLTQDGLPMPGGEAPVQAQVLAALESLGWSEKDAEKAWQAVAEDQPDVVASDNVSVVLKSVLQSLSRTR